MPTGGSGRVRSTSEKIWEFLLHVFLILIVVSIILPFWFTLVSSFEKVETIGVRFWPERPTLDSYKALLERPMLGTAAFNTVARTVIGTFLTTVISFATAYVLSKRNLPFNRFLTIIVIIPMFFGGGLIPFYLQMKKMGLVNNFLLYILPSIVSGYYIMVMRNFLYSIPGDVEESALIDGANEVRILFSIYLPMSLPIIATIALWSAVSHWNEWFTGYIYMTDQKLIVLSVMLRRVLMEAQTTDLFNDPAMIQQMSPKGLRSALIFVTILPILAVYPFAQKYFVVGLTDGAVKG